MELRDDAPVEISTSSLPAALGSPGLAQGAYGDAGNLELTVPAATGGFWCLWFNADPVDHRKGAVRHSWSRPLHVPGAYRTSVRISQVFAGPRFLETVAVGDGALWRHHWSPTDGFVDDGAVSVDHEPIVDIARSSALVEHAAGLHGLAVTDDGRLLHLQAPIDAYPDLAWSVAEIGTEITDVELTRSGGALVATVLDAGGVAHVRRLQAKPGQWQETARYDRAWRCATTTSLGVIGLDEDRHVVVIDVDGVHRPWPELTATDLTACASTLSGGRFDIVLRSGSDLLHGFGRHGMWTAPRLVTSRVWS